jgi:hypothetical protein
LRYEHPSGDRLPDLATHEALEAREEALRILRQLLKDSPGDSLGAVEITDRTGLIVEVVTLGDLN